MARQKVKKRERESRSSNKTGI